MHEIHNLNECETLYSQSLPICAGSSVPGCEKMTESFIAKFPLPVFLAGGIFGILFCYGIGYIALKIDFEKAVPVFHWYGIGFDLGVIAAGICFILAAAINSSCFSKSKDPEFSNLDITDIIKEVQNG